MSQTTEDNLTKLGGCVKGNVGVMHYLSFLPEVKGHVTVTKREKHFFCNITIITDDNFMKHGMHAKGNVGNMYNL